MIKKYIILIKDNIKIILNFISKLINHHSEEHLGIQAYPPC